ncbi:MAG: hypothetical protein FJ161_01670 [Gammaproteobacteria bacterium]|nr:hypothetical protein [Gammaproteobacteria bacterium]
MKSKKCDYAHSILDEMIQRNIAFNPPTEEQNVLTEMIEKEQYSLVEVFVHHMVDYPALVSNTFLTQPSYSWIVHCSDDVLVALDALNIFEMLLENKEQLSQLITKIVIFERINAYKQLKQIYEERNQWPLVIEALSLNPNIIFEMMEGFKKNQDTRNSQYIILDLINSGLPCEVYNAEQSSLLSIVIIEKYDMILKPIIQAFASQERIDYVDPKSYYTAFMQALLVKNHYAAEMLIDHGADLLRTTVDDFTTLMWACRANDRFSIEKILQKIQEEKDFAFICVMNHTRMIDALYMAMVVDEDLAIKIIQMWPEDKDFDYVYNDNYTPLMMAIYAKYDRAAFLILEKMKNHQNLQSYINIRPEDPQNADSIFAEAIRGNCYNTLRLLIDLIQDVNCSLTKKSDNGILDVFSITMPNDVLTFPMRAYRRYKKCHPDHIAELDLEVETTICLTGAEWVYPAMMLLYCKYVDQGQIEKFIDFVIERIIPVLIGMQNVDMLVEVKDFFDEVLPKEYGFECCARKILDTPNPREYFHYRNLWFVNWLIDREYMICDWTIQGDHLFYVAITHGCLSIAAAIQQGCLDRNLFDEPSQKTKQTARQWLHASEYKAHADHIIKILSSNLENATTRHECYDQSFMQDIESQGALFSIIEDILYLACNDTPHRNALLHESISALRVWLYGEDNAILD